MKNFIFLITILCNYAYGICQKHNADLYFANGMFNSEEAARESLNYLRKKLQKDYPQMNYDNYNVAYNTNEFVLLQLLQVYRHKFEEGTIDFWNWLGNFSNFKESPIFKAQLEKIFSYQSINDHDLRKQIARYQKSLDENHSVITVAHSQGNFYTNFAFEKIRSTKTAMISVATPTSLVYGRGPYFTFISDGVIKYIPSALPANRERTPAGLFDHEFIIHYLNDPLVGKEILESVHNAYQNSIKPAEGEMNEDLDRTLTWHHENSKKKRSDRMSDCLLSYAIFKLKASQLSCEEKSFSKLSKFLSDCKNDRHAEKEKENKTSCPFWQGMDINFDAFARMEGFPRKENSSFLDLHPHCLIESQVDYLDRVEITDIEEAISTLKELQMP